MLFNRRLGVFLLFRTNLLFFHKNLNFKEFSKFSQFLKSPFYKIKSAKLMLRCVYTGAVALAKTQLSTTAAKSSRSIASQQLVGLILISTFCQIEIA